MMPDPIIQPMEFHPPGFNAQDFDAWSKDLLRRMARAWGMPPRLLTNHYLPKRLRNRGRRQSLAALRARVAFLERRRQ